MFDKKRLIKPSVLNGLLVSAMDYGILSAREYVPTYIKAIPDPERIGNVSHTFINDWLLNPSNMIVTSMNQPHFTSIQLGAATLFLGLVAKDLWHTRKHRVEKADQYGAFGTASFLTLKDLKRDKKDFSLSLDASGTILGMINGKPVIHSEQSHKNRNILIFGASGTQKSKAHIIPNILNTEHDSIIVTDPKAELYETTSEAKRKQGYKVHLINFDIRDSLNSDKYNPLDYIETDLDAAELGNTLVINSSGMPSNGDNFWVNSEAGAIATLALYAKYFLPKPQQHMGSVYNLLVASPETLHGLFQDVEDSHIVKRSYNGCIGNKEEKMRSQIIGGAATAIDLWKYDQIRHLTYESDFHLQDLGREKKIIYLKMPVGKKAVRPLVSTFFNQLFEQLYRLAEENHGRLPQPVRMLLDEFSNIGQIPMFEERLSTTRSYGIYVTAVLQSVEQLKNRYGREKAFEIMDNADCHLFMGTNDKDSQKHFSEKLGMTTIRIQGESQSKNDRGESLGESRNYVSRPLMTSEEINRLPDDKLIAFMRTKHPMMLDKSYYTKLKPLASLMEERVKLQDYRSKESGEYEVFEVPNGREKPKENPIDKIAEELNGELPQEPSKEPSKTEQLMNVFDI
ncbi:type IV secretory system conjugative DNA transfer family protein [Bacillus sp. JJ634]